MTQVPLEVVINGLTVAAGASLLVERSIEWLKSVRERAYRQLITAESGAAASVAVGSASAHAEVLASRWQVSTDSDPVSAARQLQATLDSVAVVVNQDSSDSSFEQSPPILHVPLPVISLNQARLDLFIRLAPVAIGIILAGWFELHLVALFTGQTVESSAVLLQRGEIWACLRNQLDTLLSGVLIGGGSQPVHLLLTLLTKRQLAADPTNATSEAGNTISSPRCEPAAVSTDGDLAWRDIPYSGGVRPDTLQTVHLRSGWPDQVVVHHTAMHSALGFNAITDEFFNHKGWLTGYHAVIMPDGSIQPFCRWDRTGNHAKGQNRHTLGVAFHGNFHNGQDRFANPDGRYGNLVPTSQQLDAGARLIALWMHLYDLDAERPDCITPHRALPTASTVCPGSRFPWNELNERVYQYYRFWQDDDKASQALAAYRQRPYLYPDTGRAV